MFSTLSCIAMAQPVEVFRYKTEGRGFDSRWWHWNFFIDVLLTAAVWSTQPLKEMSTRNISCVLETAYHLRVPIFLKSGSLKILQTSGPVAQPYKGISLPFNLSCLDDRIMHGYNRRNVNLVR
jgi:hypothetical protein